MTLEEVLKVTVYHSDTSPPENLVSGPLLDVQLQPDEDTSDIDVS